VSLSIPDPVDLGNVVGVDTRKDIASQLKVLQLTYSAYTTSDCATSRDNAQETDRAAVGVRYSVSTGNVFTLRVKKWIDKGNIPYPPLPFESSTHRSS